MTRTFATLAAAILLAGATAAPAASPAAPAWVQESNEHAKVLLEIIARFSPEGAGSLGMEGFDAGVTDLQPRRHQRYQAAIEDAIETLEKRLAKASHPAVKQDLEIMIDAARRELTSRALAYERTVPYLSISRVVFGGIRDVLDPRLPPERQAHGVQRLKRYAGLEPGYTPIAELARDRIEERLGKKGLIPPYKGQVEQHLADSPRLIAGIRELFLKSGLTGWEEAHAALATQITAYDDWVRTTLLPKARTDHRLPPELYMDALRNYGVEIAPEQLIQEALIEYKEIRTEMEALAPLVAKKASVEAPHGRDKSPHYLAVIRDLKTRQIANTRLLSTYQKRLSALEDIIRRENFVTLPARKATIRLASEAESAMTPAPNMRPPQLINNTGQHGEFVLPLSVPGRGDKADLRMDDFSHDAATWTLTAHEARPGHELQFTAMVEKGISNARAIFAFNSVNVEGWALYAEAEMKPYLPLDGQLITLQLRLQRAARAFLDPMVNLGMITPDEVKRVLMEEVGLSEAMTQQEVDRYTFRSPGQATAYFHGYRRLLETRQRAELALKDKFDRKAFHDFVLSQGLLPPELLQKAVMEEFVR